MRLLAVSSPVNLEIDGKQAADDQGRGHRPRDDQLAGDRRAARHHRRRARADRRLGHEGDATRTAWKKSEKKFDWTPFVKTGAELDRFLAAEQKRVQAIVADLGLDRMTVSWTRRADRRRSCCSRSA